MASIISAGTTSGTALNMAGDTSGVLELATNGSTTAVTIDTSQNVGIGTASPVGSMQLLRSADPQFIITDAFSSSFTLGTTTGLSIVGTDAAAITFKTGVTTGSLFATGTERMRIDSNGNLLVNQTSTSAGADGIFSVTSTTASPAATFKNSSGSGQYTNVVYNSATTGDNLFILFGTETSFTPRGSITYNRAAGLTSYNTTSDERLKDNIVDASSALSKIDSVKIRSFDWKETGNHVDFGVIAQELITVAPECVTEGQDNEDGTMKTSWAVDTSALVPALIKAIQEQQTIINDLKARITALEGAA